MSKKIKVAVLILAVTMLTACGSTGQTNDNVVSENTIEKEDIEVGDISLDYNQYRFSDEDLDPSFDEASATFIRLSDEASEVDGTGVVLDEGEIRINEEGTYVISGEMEDVQIIVDAPESAKVQLVLDDVTLHSESSAPIYVKEAGHTMITLKEGTTNTLTDASEYELTDAEHNINGVIYSRSPLTLNGTGTLHINANYKHGIVSRDELIIASGVYDIVSSNHGIVGKDYVKIADGVFNIEAGKDGIQSDSTKEEKGYIYIEDGAFNLTVQNDGIQAESLLLIDGGEFNVFTGEGSENASVVSTSMKGGFRGETSTEEDTESMKGLKARGDIVINDGVFDIDAYDDAVHSDSHILINDGNFVLASGDDAIHADESVVINGGVIDIVRSYEGIEGYSVTINDGIIFIVASDDGINASGESDIADHPYILITGGVTTIDASGDGIDANGNFYVEGGELYIHGNPGMESAIDYDLNAEISGGIVVAVGNSGMAYSFMDTSEQNSIFCNLSTMLVADEQLTLTDSTGEELITFMPKKSYNSILISIPELVEGETYILQSGSERIECIAAPGSEESFNVKHQGQGGMDKPEGGHKDIPEGGHMDKPEGGHVDIPDEGHRDIPEGGHIDIPDEGHKDVPEGGHVDIPDEGHKDVPEGGHVDIPDEGHKDIPGEG